MARHMVVCVKCGRQFDANKGRAGYISYSRRYVCPSCFKIQQSTAKSAAADEREKRTGMRQSTGAMIAKIAVGVLFIISAPGTEGAAALLAGIVLGAALIAWGLVPWLKARKTRQEAARREAEEREAAKQAVLNAPKICSACGAHTKGIVCEYCGSPLD